MVENTIEQLEWRIDELIKLCDYLKEENRALHAQIVELASEQARLIEQTELARSRVEAMIIRLKSMEQAS
ncbi:MAG: TIGR02449 family protein [Candidatus Nitrosoglobus sp.]|jgi:cell division protein ZapB